MKPLYHWNLAQTIELGEAVAFNFIYGDLAGDALDSTTNPVPGFQCL